MKVTEDVNLFQINGERLPADVYQDFRAAVFRILGSQDNPPVFSSGKIAPIPVDVATTELSTVVCLLLKSHNYCKICNKYKEKIIRRRF